MIAKNYDILKLQQKNNHQDEVDVSFNQLEYVLQSDLFFELPEHLQTERRESDSAAKSRELDYEMGTSYFEECYHIFTVFTSHFLYAVIGSIFKLNLKFNEGQEANDEMNG